MTQYDLNIFSPSEFEEFCRDILQVKLNIFIESFKTGKDGGIDLRFSTPENKNVIIQSKRYKDITSLKNNLKKEVPKVKKLNPSSYIITTSIGLSPYNKEEIKKLFEPYIESTENIYGKDDLLNILAQNKKIEEKYYKLWIASTTILEKVIHNKIYNQSQFELQEIKNQTKLFVQNESFHEALKILDKYRYIIISGIPGIGKTTLSRILTQYLLSNGYDEFIYLSDKIDDGYTYFKEDKKQVFLFDDFLGKNFFEAKSLQKNDDKIVKFINKIKDSPDKILILATREYILNQAKEVYEAFKIHDIEIAKCIIDLSTYTKIIKAKILYNHLFHGQIPEEYLNNLLEFDNYKKLINHTNYNPRIIETFIKQKIWNNCKPVLFFNTIKGYFDNPQSVWLYSFENSLDKFSQYTLLVLSTLGNPVLLTDLEIAVESFLLKNSKLGINFDSLTFSKSIRELENTFIKTILDKKGDIVIEYQNPSIYDFLVNYLKDKNKIIDDLITSFIFVDQFQTIFSGQELFGKIRLKQELIDSLADKLIELENNYKTCRIYKIEVNGLQFTKNYDYIYGFINYLNTHYSIYNRKIKEFIYNSFNQRLIFTGYSYHSDYLNLLGTLELSKFKIDKYLILDSFLIYSYSIYHLELFESFFSIFPEKYQEYINSTRFFALAHRLILEENIKDEETIYYKATLETVNAKYNLGLENHINEIEILSAQFDSYINHEIDITSNMKSDDYFTDNLNEDVIIKEIFNGLKEL
ncbi:restriction endonuclease [Chryseobacterium sp. RG1]|uniref:Restriction endonuclease n=1 Tax=Chryseobacterium tagetis TaxID=2801334 RepID=A0ABS8A4S4_9FLAO|nr:restriction endonuclease [Chryseobacterium tagetis]MCA6068977.1 restriction endonuclease [Chryseobacterium tagetis]